MTYPLFDTSLGRLMRVFASEEAALVHVRTLLGVNDPDFADDLALGGETDDGRYAEPISGAALVARAEEAVADREPIAPRPGRAIASPARSA